MIQASLFAVLTGFILSFGFGSVFFALLQTSIEFGQKAGFKMAVGVLCSDIILVGIALAGTAILPKIPNFSLYTRLLCASLLIFLAFRQLRGSSAPPQIKEFRLTRFFYFFGKGFLLNGINPVNFLTWVVLITAIKSYHLSQEETAFFFLICLATICFTECLMAHFASKLKVFLRPQNLKHFKQLTAVIFILIAIKFVWDTFR